MLPNLMTEGDLGACCGRGDRSEADFLSDFLSASFSAGFSILMDLNSCRPFCSEVRVKDV